MIIIMVIIMKIMIVIIMKMMLVIVLYAINHDNDDVADSDSSVVGAAAAVYNDPVVGCLYSESADGDCVDDGDDDIVYESIMMVSIR